MKKCAILAVDVGGDAPFETMTLNGFSDLGWELVSVVGLPLSRRAYFKREIPESPAATSIVAEERLPTGDEFGDPQDSGQEILNLREISSASEFPMTPDEALDDPRR